MANIAAQDSALEQQTIARFAAAFEACLLLHTPESDNVIVVGSAALPTDLAPALKALDGQGHATARVPGSACSATEATWERDLL